jgi:ParB-like chromosome segregation protein Spo0J
VCPLALPCGRCERHGLLHPIIVSTETVLLVGRRRLAACAQLGWATIPARVIDLDDPLGAEVDENVVRKVGSKYDRNRKLG